jgi:hypothetical protein
VTCLWRPNDALFSVCPIATFLKFLCSEAGCDRSRNNGDVSPMNNESLKSIVVLRGFHSAAELVVGHIDCHLGNTNTLLKVAPQPTRQQPPGHSKPTGPSASHQRLSSNEIGRRVQYSFASHRCPLQSRTNAYTILSCEPAKKFSTHLNPDVYKGAGWRSRGYLPHLDRPGLIQTITFRLADSLPKEALERWSREIEKFPESDQKNEIRQRIQYFIDQGYGSCYLRVPLKTSTLAQIS